MVEPLAKKWIDYFQMLYIDVGGGGGGGLLPYTIHKLYRYVPPQRVWFSSLFGLKTGIDFDHYGLKSGTVFKGTMRAYNINERIPRSTPQDIGVNSQIEIECKQSVFVGQIK